MDSRNLSWLQKYRYENIRKLKNYSLIFLFTESSSINAAQNGSFQTKIPPSADTDTMNFLSGENLTLVMASA